MDRAPSGQRFHVDLRRLSVRGRTNQHDVPDLGVPVDQKIAFRRFDGGRNDVDRLIYLGLGQQPLSVFLGDRRWHVAVLQTAGAQIIDLPARANQRVGPNDGTAFDGTRSAKLPVSRITASVKESLLNHWAIEREHCRPPFSLDRKDFAAGLSPP